MKRLPLTVLLSCCALLSAVPAHAESASELTSEGQHAYLAGDAETAKVKFKEALKLDPDNPVAKNYLRMIVTEELRSNSGSNKLQAALKKLIVPVEFNDATLSSALDYLKKQAAKASNGQVEPSFVIEPGVDPATRVTLHLSQVPFTEVLRYVGNLVNADFVIEQYAISVKPKAGDGTVSASAPRGSAQ